MTFRQEIIGDATLILEDCREVLPTLGRFDAIVSDPPYGIGYSPGGGGGIRDKNGRRLGKGFTGANIVVGDSEPFDPKFLVDLGVPTILWGANHYASRLPDSASWLVWNKLRPPTDFADCEMAWCSLGFPARLRSHEWNGMLRASERGIPRVHPTQKPIEIMQWCLGFLPAAQTILDPFMGSGTTGVACSNLGCAFTGIEAGIQHSTSPGCSTSARAPSAEADHNPSA